MDKNLVGTCRAKAIRRCGAQIALAFLILFIPQLLLAGDNGSWKLPLAEKANILEQMVMERHNIDGLYPSLVRIEKDGTMDPTAAGDANVAHSVNWTSYYLCGQLLRYQLTKDPQVHDWVKHVWKGFRRVQTVNGVPGLLSRGYVLGHGPSYEERANPREDRWHQGKGAFANYRWRGHPSHHTYSGALRAYGMVYDYIDDEQSRKEVRQDLAAIGRYAFLDNDMLIKTVEGERSCTLMLWPPEEIASTRGLMVLGELTVIKYVTQDPAIEAYFEEILERFKIREKWAKASVEDLLKAAKMGGGFDYDDTEHCLGHIYNMLRMETDPELLEYYKKFADAMWESKKNDRLALFNYIYETIRPGQGKIQDGFWYLKQYPTLKIFQPQMNSLRDDLPDHPLPYHERPFDNEYDFKGNPYQKDGWLSRIVTQVAASPHDPEVLYACDQTGEFYRSFDGGDTWEDSYLGLGDAPVKQIAVWDKRFNVVAVATEKGGFWSWDSGTRWHRLIHPDSAYECLLVGFLEDKQGKILVLMNDGLFISQWGHKPFESWDRVCELPCEPGEGIRACMDADGFVYLSKEGEGWRMDPGTGSVTRWGRLPESGSLAWLSAGQEGRLYGRIDSDSSQQLVKSTDRGSTWALLSCDAKGLHGLAEDPTDGTRLYVAGERGVWLSQDAGTQWERVQKGLDIPVVRSIVSCPARGKVYAGTLAGLFVSDNKGAAWKGTALVPQFEGCRRMETGPADYLYAYWLGRYHGFITDEQDTAPFSGE